MWSQPDGWGGYLFLPEAPEGNEGLTTNGTNKGTNLPQGHREIIEGWIWSLLLLIIMLSSRVIR